MEATVAGGGGGGGGPAPFLIKTYEMVDDSSTDEIVSWSSSNASFVVWNPPEFAAKLLPTYFKHNNFSSFIRQLNTYGFRKIDPERWEFANEEFIKDQKHLLKNIHRRKPIHSHSHPPLGSSLPDPERMALEEEIERLSREKVALTADLWRFKQHHSGTRIQLEDLDRRLHDMEQRQATMLAFLDRALRNPKFVDNLIKMASASGPDLLFSSSVLHKKRRLPGGLHSSLDTFYQDNNKPDAGQAFSQDFCDKLKLGLCSAAAISESSDGNLDLAVVTASATPRSSDEPGGSPRVVEHSRNGNGRLECLAFVPDTLEHEHSDAGASLCPRRNPLFPPGSPDDGGDGLIPCHLNLTLASSSMQIDKSASLSTSQNSIPEEAMTGNEGGGTDREATRDRQSNTNHSADRNATPSQEEAARTSGPAPPAAPGRVNDVFWEQFLTERPGSSDTEEASSNLRMDHCVDPQEGRRPGYDGMRKSRKDMERLSL